MPRVLLLQIDDDQQADTARGLLRAHLCIVILGVLVAILGVIYTLTLDKALSDLQKASNAAPEQRRGPGGIPSIIIYILLPILCPMGVLLTARQAISGNSDGFLTCVCFLDGLCSCCTFLSAISCVFGFISYNALSQWASALMCDGTDDVAMCEKAKTSTANVFAIVAVCAIIMAVLNILQCLSCAFGTWKSQEAKTSIQCGKVFTGPPKVPQTYVGSPAGGQFVGGQPVVSPMVMGQPVMGEVVVVGLPVVGLPVVVQLQNVQT